MQASISTSPGTEDLAYHALYFTDSQRLDYAKGTFMQSTNWKGN